MRLTLISAQWGKINMSDSMKLQRPIFSLASLPSRLRGMFNLNDPRWGRSDDPSDASDGQGAAKPPEQAPDTPPPNQGSSGPKRGGNQGPPDLDELWRDFNRKLGGLFGNVKGGGRGATPIRGGGGGGGSGGGGSFQPDMKSAGIGMGLVAAVAVLIWLGTGFFIVQEGQQAVITQFGRYNATVGAGFNWRLPYPIQRSELVFVTQIRSVDVGRDVVIKATGLRESAMLTEDENIVEIKFAVQYRLNDARAFLFESKNPADAVVQAAETAVREVVGKMKMDSALSEERDQIAPRVRAMMQTSWTATRWGSRWSVSTCSKAACGLPNRCRPLLTMCSRPVRSASAPRTKPRPTPTTLFRVPSVRLRA
jgi:membrane protease subunit HflK